MRRYCGGWLCVSCVYVFRVVRVLCVFVLLLAGCECCRCGVFVFMCVMYVRRVLFCYVRLFLLYVMGVVVAGVSLVCVLLLVWWCCYVAVVLVLCV